MLMLKGDLLLDSIKLSSYPRIILVTVSVQPGKGGKPFFRLAVVDEPTGRLWEDHDEGCEPEGREHLDSEGGPPLAIIVRCEASVRA